MEIEEILLSQIIPADYNPRKISDEDFKKLDNSMENFGLVDPIIINLKKPSIITQLEYYIVIGGHQRLDVLIRKGVKKAHLLRLGDVGWVFTEKEIKLRDENTVKALNIALNKISGEWDEPLLQELLEGLQLDGFDVELTGFDETEIQKIDNKINTIEVEEDNFDPDKEIEAICKPGDMWRLGNHRLLCADSTKKKNIELLMQENKADMVFTDPPYDFKDDDKLFSSIDLATHNSHIFIMHDDRGIVNYLRTSNFDFDRFFILDTKIASPRGNDPYLRHIIVSHERKGNPIKHENQYDGFSSIIAIDYRKNIKEEKVHDHQKSVKDISKFIKHYSKKKHKILDIFGGSGSTLIACEQLERNCFMMEIEPHTCDIIIKRWEQFTRQKAEKIEN